MVMALIPVKNTCRAKRRLSSVLAKVERAGLARAMLHDVLGAVTSAHSISRVYVVAENDEVADICADFDVPILQEVANRGYNHAVAAGINALASYGSIPTIILPSDVPLLKYWEVDRLAAVSDGRLVRIAPSRDGTGTNGLFLSPPNVMPSYFGINSAKHHRAAALQEGIPFECLHLPGLSFDIDTPKDLQDLRALRSDTAAGCFLRQSHIFANSLVFERVQP
ncbi:MAG: 2-phospho-L-lactate guanylyltransferase [Alphaproteobacteria bacterium]|nr:2-phospho-L-lactate guanylyltransferase [Alphaproteobacteria bacterium]